MCQFLVPEIKLAHFHDFWGQHTKYVRSWAHFKLCRYNGSAKFLDPETDIKAQFLGPETDIMGERYFMDPLKSFKFY